MKKYGDIIVVGNHRDVPIYMICEKRKKRYEHGLNFFESFKTLDEALYDIDEILKYKDLCRRED